ncbi:glycoside hydrolase family 108 protein [Geoalkalibacter halelectricus]|uniref:glycoside hydrolase family 108 protein n=1 Tax=Geoalkalibacter halelectricus TaxID=2847045 RepID=UPI003D1E7E89
MSFERAISFTLQHEGGYVHDPADPGGETRFGISKRAYPDVDIKHLTIEQARDIYRRDYWEAPRIALLRSAEIAARVFDLGVNCGPATAVRMLQRAVNLLQPLERVAEDGRLGPVTAAAVNAYGHPRALLAALKFQAAAHYIALNRPRFLAGWLNRLESPI